MEKPIEAQLAKLPKWAREHIKDLERKLSGCEGEKQRLLDVQKPSPFFVDEWHATPRFKRYIVAPTNQISVEHAGVRLDVHIPYEGDPHRMNGIELKYSAIGDNVGRGVSLVPVAYSTVFLVDPKNVW